MTSGVESTLRGPQWGQPKGPEVDEVVTRGPVASRTVAVLLLPTVTHDPVLPSPATCSRQTSPKLPLSLGR